METTSTWSISSLLTDVGDVVNGAIDIAVANPLISVFLGITLIGAGYGLFTRLRRSSKK